MSQLIWHGMEPLASDVKFDVLRSELPMPTFEGNCIKRSYLLKVTVMVNKLVKLFDRELVLPLTLLCCSTARVDNQQARPQFNLQGNDDTRSRRLVRHTPRGDLCGQLQLRLGGPVPVCRASNVPDVLLG